RERVLERPARAPAARTARRGVSDDERGVRSGGGRRAPLEGAGGARTADAGIPGSDCVAPLCGPFIRRDQRGHRGGAEDREITTVHRTRTAGEAAGRGNEATGMSGTEKPSIDELMREAQAAQPEPPEDLRAGVMRRVRDVEGRLTWFQRWRRSSRATNFSSRAGVDSSNFSPLGGLIPGRVQAMKKVLVAASALGAGALVLAYWFGFPPTGQGTEGTVGAANRYQATVKLGDKDVVVVDMAVQKFMQSATFDRVMKNKNARVVLRKIA